MGNEKERHGVEIDFDNWSGKNNKIDIRDYEKEQDILLKEQEYNTKEEKKEVPQEDIASEGIKGTESEESVEDGKETTEKGLEEDFFVRKIREEFNNLEPIEFLGKGGFGTVYKCRQECAFDDAYYAVKIIELDKRDEKELKKVKREIDIQRKYSYANYSVAIRDNKIFETGAKRYVMIQMDYMDGSLKELLDEHDKLNSVEAVNIVIRLCDILAAMEKCGDAHNDIKPANILYKKIMGEKHFCLGDFGSARNSIYDTGYSEPASTSCYRPVEGDLSDIFSLGIVLMNMLGNECPSNFAKLSGKFIFKDTDSELQRICSKACAYHEEDRYQNASEMKKDLINWRNTHPDEVNLYEKTGPELLKMAEELKIVDEASWVVCGVVFGYRELTFRYLNAVIQKESCSEKNPAIQEESCSAMHSAMYHMYCMYEKAGKKAEGTGYVDKLKAELYLEKAANAKHLPAMNSYVCHMIRKERRVDPEWIKILREAAAEYTPAQYNLSLLIRTGLAEPIEEGEDRKLLQKAVEAGYGPAKKLLETKSQIMNEQ